MSELELELEPHEQLDEASLRTNDDRTVEVELLNWEKIGSYVDVNYRKPTGEVETERMEWPESNDDSYKFIRLIEETPYTLRTADQINDDDEIFVTAQPNPWSLDLPEKKPLRKQFSTDRDGVAFELIKFALYPFTVFSMLINLLEQSENANRIGRDPYEDVYLEDEVHKKRTLSAVKSAMYTLSWIFMIVILIS